MENYAENVQQMLVPDSFLILVNNRKQPLHAITPFENMAFRKRTIKKT